MTSNGDRSDRELVLDELRDADKLIVVTHENPDGDALGSLVAMQGILAALGKDCLMFIDAHEFPLPQEYRFLPLDGLVSEPPRRPRPADDRVPRLRQPRPQPRRGVPAARASTSSTSTTTTTTPASGPSTWSSRTRRARPRSSGT